jgi:hypothetical protein
MLNFNASSVQVEEDSSFDLLPKGQYAATITDTEMRTTQSGANAGTDYIVFVYTVDGPTHADRKLWDNCYFFHQGKAGQIAQQQLAKMCNALGKAGANDPAEFVGAKLLIDVGIEKSKDPQYGDKNRIYGYHPVGGPAPAAAPQKATQPTGGNGSSPPWVGK